MPVRTSIENGVKSKKPNSKRRRADDSQSAPAKSDGRKAKKQKKSKGDAVPSVGGDLPAATDFFSMQTAAFLQEVSVGHTKSTCLAVDRIVQSLESATQHMCLLNALTVPCKTGAQIRVPLPAGDPVALPIQIHLSEDDTFDFAAPTEVQFVGGFDRQLSVGPDDGCLDLAVQMPSQLFCGKDYLNCHYFRRRALYLAYCAKRLIEDLALDAAQLTWTFLEHYPRSPCLIVELSDSFRVRILAHPEREEFKLSRFLPGTGNVRPRWYFGDETVDEQAPPATPSYNQALLRDLLLCECDRLLFDQLDVDGRPALRATISLLKCWLRRRTLLGGVGGLSSVWLNAFLVHCLQHNTLKVTASVEHMLRTVFTILASGSFTDADRPVGLTDPSAGPVNPDVVVPSWAQLAAVSAGGAVLTDATGYLNFMHNTSRATLNRLRYDAERSLALLNRLSSPSRTQSAHVFQWLFVKQQRFTDTFDHILRIPLTPNWCSWLREHNQYRYSVMDEAGASRRMHQLVGPLVERALGERVTLIDQQRYGLEHVACSSAIVAEQSPLLIEDSQGVTLGLLLAETDVAHNLLLRGPPADQPEAAEFRAFWGRRSELRKFADGSVCEAVVWSSDTPSETRMLPLKIVKHALATHFASTYAGKVPLVSLSGSQLDRVISSQVSGHKTHTNEQVFTDVSQCLSKLSTALRAIQGLPLVVTAVTPVGGLYKQTEPLPPAAYDQKLHDALLAGGAIQVSRETSCCVPVASAPCQAPYRPAVEVQISLEQSGKWPSDVQALRRIKAAFHLKMAELLHKQLHIRAAGTVDAVYVHMDGHVFRLYVAYEREAQLLADGEGGSKGRPGPAALALHRQLTLAPKLDAAIHSLGSAHAVYRLVCRVCQRWLRAQMLTVYFAQPLVELLVAHLFLHPHPFTEPRSVLVGFVRFLQLLSTHDWLTSPLVVNLNAELTSLDQQSLEQQFMTQRATLPPCVVYSGVDRSGVAFTRPHPSPPVLNRAVLLAADCLRKLHQLLDGSAESLQQQKPRVYIEDQFLTLFATDLTLFDVLLHLKPAANNRRHESLDSADDKPDFKPLDPKAKLEERSPAKNVIPVVDFDPVGEYVQQLKVAFDELALFFYDPHGAPTIGVLFRPSHTTTPSTSLNRSSARRLLDGELQPDYDAVLEDMRLMGEGLVDSVSRRNK